MRHSLKIMLFIFIIIWAFSALIYADGHGDLYKDVFPKPQSRYQDSHMTSIVDILRYRVEAEPFNLTSFIIFIAAIAHTMITSWFKKLAHAREREVERRKEEGLVDRHYQSIWAGILHLLGEIEVVFGLWAVVLGGAITYHYDWDIFVHYVDDLHYREPMFILVIMTISSSRPVIKCFEVLTWKLVRLIKDSIETWWLVILILSSLLGSFITGPAAMAISAHLLADKFYSLNPNHRLKYGTLALLFVNVSIGGALTNFASPPILMVAEPWDWSTSYMFLHFGWKSLIALFISTTAYYFFFRKDLKGLKEAYETSRYQQHIQSRFVSQKELMNAYIELENFVDERVGFSSELNAYSGILKDNIKALAAKRIPADEIEKYDIDGAIEERFEDIKLEEFRKTIPGLLPVEKRPEYHDPNWNKREDHVPVWIMIVHLFFLGFTVVNAHDPVLFLGGFLFFLGFFQITFYYQNHIDLKPALLVAFFIAGLVIHGTLQAWWIAPLLAHLPALGLNVTSIALTAFNDNAAITYLSTLVPNLPDTYKYAIVSGALTGGGLTIIANSPNPIGQSILKKHFPNGGISAFYLFLFALLPTVITALCFLLL